jgi:hypothetical protein
MEDRQFWLKLGGDVDLDPYSMFRICLSCSCSCLCCTSPSHDE